MRIRKAVAALSISLALVGTAACGPQDQCYDDDGDQIPCGQNYGDDDDDEYDDDDDEGEWEDD